MQRESYRSLGLGQNLCWKCPLWLVDLPDGKAITLLCNTFVLGGATDVVFVDKTWQSTIIPKLRPCNRAGTDCLLKSQ